MKGFELDVLVTDDMDLSHFMEEHRDNSANKGQHARAMFGWGCAGSDIPLQKKRRQKCASLAQVLTGQGVYSQIVRDIMEL